MTEQRLTQAEFTKLVGEVERLSQLRDQEINREQMLSLIHI